MTTIDTAVQKIREHLEKQDATKVKVALFGQPGAGKSALINALVGKQVAKSGVQTDLTVEATSYEHNGIVLVDLPGYGTAKFPREGYTKRFKIESFDLFLCVVSGKFTKQDTVLFEEVLRKLNKVCIFVSNKQDSLHDPKLTVEQLQQQISEDLSKHLNEKIDVVFTSCKTGFGIDALEKRVLSSLDEARQDRWLRGAKAHSKAFLEKKREACEKYVANAALLSAANGINPVLGLDVAVDVSVLLGLFKKIRENYGLSEEELNSLTHSAAPMVANLANSALKFATKEGVIVLLKRFAGRKAVQEFGKFVPLVGQVIAAGIGYAITSNAGQAYLEDCHKLAALALDSKLKA